MKLPSPQELADLDAKVSDALRTGDESGLTILGYGEISTVVALHTAQGAFACKRLPPFGDAARFEAYQGVFRRYLEELSKRGVKVLDSHPASVHRSDGDLGVFCVQPLFDGKALATKVLASCSDAEGMDLFRKILDRVQASVGPRLGLDGQLSNWAVLDGEPHFIDVTTPLLRDAEGRDQLDVDLFLASLPWLLRGAVKRFMLAEILDKYFDPRGVVLDLLGNLFKEGLERWLQPFMAEANSRFAPHFSADEAWKYYEGDAKTWALLLAVRRFDRWWQRNVRRRTYRFLLPGPIERNLVRPAGL